MSLFSAKISKSLNKRVKFLLDFDRHLRLKTSHSQPTLQRTPEIMNPTPSELIDALAYGSDESEFLAKVRTPDGVKLVTYNPATSALISMHTASQAKGNGFEARQLNAGLRLENDHLAGTMGSSNAATIAKHLERSLKASAEDQRKKTFGHVMRAAPESKPHIDVCAVRLDAAYRNGWIIKRMNKVSWTMLNLFIIYDMSLREIAAKTGMDGRYLGLRIREALSELAALYDLFDKTGGRDAEHPSYVAPRSQKIA